MMETKNNDVDIYRNAEGYLDPTAYPAMKEADQEEKRFYKLLYTLFNVITLSGFQLHGRITLEDKRTGKIWE